MLCLYYLATSSGQMKGLQADRQNVLVPCTNHSINPVGVMEEQEACKYASRKERRMGMEAERGVHKSNLFEECTPPHVTARERCLHTPPLWSKATEERLPTVDKIPMAVITGLRPVYIPIQ